MSVGSDVNGNGGLLLDGAAHHPSQDGLLRAAFRPSWTRLQPATPNAPPTLLADTATRPAAQAAARSPRQKAIKSELCRRQTLSECGMMLFRS
jgi:hypothetical protein